MACAKKIAISWPAKELQHGEISIEFELQGKIISEIGPWRYVSTK